MDCAFFKILYKTCIQKTCHWQLLQVWLVAEARRPYNSTLALNWSQSMLTSNRPPKAAV